jgi:hypothetical protein
MHKLWKTLEEMVRPISEHHHLRGMSDAAANVSLSPAWASEIVRVCSDVIASWPVSRVL